MILSIASILLHQATATPQVKVEPKMRTYQFVMLSAGKSKDDLSQEQIDMKQAQHLEMMRSMWDSKMAIIMAPVTNDPKLKAIMIMDVVAPSEASEVLKRDPWISGGYLKMESITWWSEENSIRRGKDLATMGNYYLGLLRRPENLEKLTPEASSELQEGHMANINRMAKDGYLVAAGPFENGGNLRGLFFFKGIDPKKIEAEVAKDPVVAAGRLKLELTQLSISKGSFALEK